MAKVIVQEMKGWPHVFTLKDGTTLRLYPRRNIELDEEKVSDELLTAAKMKFITIFEKPGTPSPAVKADSTSGTRKKT